MRIKDGLRCRGVRVGGEAGEGPDATPVFMLFRAAEARGNAPHTRLKIPLRTMCDSSIA